MIKLFDNLKLYENNENFCDFQNLSPGSVTTEMYTKFHSTQKTSIERALKIGETPEISLVPEDIADAVLYILSTPTRVKVFNLFSKCRYIIIQTGYNYLYYYMFVRNFLW